MTIETRRTKEAILRQATEEFLKTGVAWHKTPATIVYPSKDKSRLGEPMVRLHLRKVAKEAKRPFIHATSEWFDVAGTDADERLITFLTIPRHKRMHTVGMALFIVAAEAPTQWSRFRTDEPVLRWENKTNWYFQFADEVGHRIFDSFIDQCTNDPIFRVVLNNTTPVTPKVIPLAA